MREATKNTKLKSVSAVLIFAVFITISCKKETTPQKIQEPVTKEMSNGFPTNPSSINGYFYASYQLNSPPTSGYYFARASFGDPGRNLLANFDHSVETDVFTPNNDDRPNVQVNNVHLNNMPLTNSNSGFSAYFLENTGQSQPFFPDVTWKIQGNKSFVAFEKSVPRGFPNFTSDAANTFTAYMSKGQFELQTNNFAV